MAVYDDDARGGPRMTTGAAKGHSAVMAMKKPTKLSDGTAWEKLELFPTPPWATRALFEIALPRVIECGRANHRRPTAERPALGLGLITNS